LSQIGEISVAMTMDHLVRYHTTRAVILDSGFYGC